MPSKTTPSDDTDSATTLDTPSWNSSDNTFPHYAIALVRWLPLVDVRYKTLVEWGYIIERREIVCVSENHIDNLRYNLIVKGSFTAPCMIAPGDVSPVPAIVAMSAEMRATDLASADRKRYTINPELIAQYHTSMLNHIKSTIPDSDTQDELEE